MSKYKQVKQEIKTRVRNAHISGREISLQHGWMLDKTYLIELSEGMYVDSIIIPYEIELVEKWIKEVEEETSADVVK